MRDKKYEIAKNCKYDECWRALASMVYKYFQKKAGSGVSVNQQLVEESHQSLIKKFERINSYARFKDNIWAADLAEMWSLSWKIKLIIIYYTPWIFSLNMCMG